MGTLSARQGVRRAVVFAAAAVGRAMLLWAAPSVGAEPAPSSHVEVAALEREWRELRGAAVAVKNLADFDALLGRVRVAALQTWVVADSPHGPSESARRLLRASDAGDAWLPRALAHALRGEDAGAAAGIRALAGGPIAGLYRHVRGFEPATAVGAWEQTARLEPHQLAVGSTVAQQTLVLGSLAGALEESGFPFALSLAGGIHGELARRLPRDLRVYAAVPALEPYSAAGDYRRFVAALADGDNPGGRTLVAASVPWLGPALLEAAEVGAEWALARVALAWRVHGGPAEWEELGFAGVWRAAPRDPFSGRALRIDVARGLAWSVGPDGRDDDGAGEPWLRRGPDRPLRWRAGVVPAPEAVNADRIGG